MTSIRTLAGLLAGGWLLLTSCQTKEPTPTPTAEQLITSKWWCPSGALAQQYFATDGTWKQRLTNSDTPDTGNWHFSADKKTIQIRNVKSTTQLLTEWDYTVERLEATTLHLTFFDLPINYQPCP